MKTHVHMLAAVLLSSSGLLFASDENAQNLNQTEAQREARCSQELISYVRMAGKGGSATGAVVSGLIARHGACGAVMILSQTR
jgi:hypothetical protein